MIANGIGLANNPGMKILSPKIHGYLDFVVVLAFALAPSLFAFSSTVATLSYAIATIHLILTLITRFPMGIVKWVPFPVHGILEFIIAFALMGAPWIFGFDAEVAARSFYLGMGVLVLIVVFFTDYKSAQA